MAEPTSTPTATQEPSDAHHRFAVALRELPRSQLTATIIVARQAGWRDRDLARLIDITPGILRAWVAHADPAVAVMPIPVPAPPPQASRRVHTTAHRIAAATARIVAGYQAGGSIRALAAETGVSYGAVRRVLVQHGVPLRPRGGFRRQRGQPARATSAHGRQRPDRRERDSPVDTYWWRALAAAQRFWQQHGHLVPPRSYVDDGVVLGAWLGRQRRDWNRLDPGRRAALEALKPWWLDPLTCEGCGEPLLLTPSGQWRHGRHTGLDRRGHAAVGSSTSPPPPTVPRVPAPTVPTILTMGVRRVTLRIRDERQPMAYAEQHTRGWSVYVLNPPHSVEVLTRDQALAVLDTVKRTAVPS